MEKFKLKEIRTAKEVSVYEIKTEKESKGLLMIEEPHNKQKYKKITLEEE